ncbi:hypothetical protein KTS45_14385 [Halomicroarcula limicola]|uniref:DUF7260 domain-containing protein n=1 Tax=Haloarcula limicola TaxID=1429915 RepID=A0A8J8C4C2_9EURY|nr:hypothetical protein [Halomicroarcula limicola]MBV0925391.1 hypothetical protein [Halomicroarcula limicola]
MAAVSDPDDSLLFVDSLREYVLEPLIAAESMAAREHTELTAERDAFAALRERVEAVEPVQTVTTQSPSWSMSSSGSTACAEVRTAYRETVMTVDHYDEVYDEPLLQNVTAELSPDIGGALDPESGVQFSPQVKRLVLASVEDCVERRTALCEVVERELDALADQKRALIDLLDELDGCTIPEWYGESFDAELTAVMSARQRHLQHGLQQFEGTEFCSYLYGDEGWTHPVLTAVARLREAVVTDE